MSYINAGPTETGLVLRTKLNNQLTNLINVKDHGAVGNGVTDDAAAFQAAVDYMVVNGGIVTVPDGHYKINTEINCQTFAKGKNCSIVGIGRVLLDFSEKITKTSGFDIGTSSTALASGAAITEDIARGDKSITCDLDVVRGDIIQIYSTDSWGGVNLEIYKRELACVLSVAAGVIYLDRGVYDSYDKTTTVIVKQNSSKFTLANIDFLGNPNVECIGLTARNFKDIRLDDCNFSGFYTANVSLYDIYGGIIRNNNLSNSIRDGYGYGLALSLCQDLLVERNVISDCRHCIMMGTTSRSVLIQGNYLTPTDGHISPLDNHESCEYVTMRDNFIWGGGILLRGLNNNIINNTIYNTVNGTGIEIQVYGYPNRTNQFLNITGNRIIPAGGSSMFGLKISFTNSNDTIDKVTIANNIFETGESSVYISAAADKTGNSIGTLLFDGNHFIVTGNNPVFQFDTFGELTYENIIVNGGRIKSPHNGLSIHCSSGSGNLYLNNVVIETIGIPVTTSELTNIFIKSCHVKSNQYLNLSCSSSVVLQNNILENMIKGGIKINVGVATYTHGGNVKINCTGDVENAATATNDGTDY